MNNETNKRSTFSGKIGFVLSAAGASVGLGNIWRFPYLAAKYGGGIFLLVYILLALTFGYTMIVAESALGRMTRKSPVGAFKFFGKAGWLSFGGGSTRHSNPDRTVLLRNRWMGHQVSGRVHSGKCKGTCNRWIFFRFYFKRGIHRSLLCSLLPVHADHHLCWCA